MRFVTRFLSLSAIFAIAVSCASDDGEHGFQSPAPGFYNDADLDWNRANLTWYESYPDPNSEECIEFNGCYWSGQLAYFDSAQSKTWISNSSIIAVHSDFWSEYRGHILRIRQGGHQIDAMVYDLCSDDDCDGCCTRNMYQTGFLIDMEIHTFNDFNADEGVVDWACLDCN
jgi:hypothetical protein